MEHRRTICLSSQFKNWHLQLTTSALNVWSVKVVLAVSTKDTYKALIKSFFLSVKPLNICLRLNMVLIGRVIHMLEYVYVQAVAVKRLDRNRLQGSREFFSEVITLSLVKHPNLVKLIGYCVEGDQKMLVYELMVNGSLESHLLGINIYIHIIITKKT